MADYDTAAGTPNVNMTNWRTRVGNTLPGITLGGTNSPTITVAGPQATITTFLETAGADSSTRQLSVVAQSTTRRDPCVISVARRACAAAWRA